MNIEKLMEDEEVRSLVEDPSEERRAFALKKLAALTPDRVYYSAEVAESLTRNLSGRSVAPDTIKTIIFCLQHAIVSPSHEAPCAFTTEMRGVTLGDVEIGDWDVKTELSPFRLDAQDQEFVAKLDRIGERYGNQLVPVLGRLVDSLPLLFVYQTAYDDQDPDLSKNLLPSALHDIIKAGEEISLNLVCVKAGSEENDVLGRLLIQRIAPVLDETLTP